MSTIRKPISGPLEIPIQLELLKRILGESGLPESRINVIERTPNPYSDTFPTEIITLGVDKESEFRLFCKYYDGKMQRDLGHGHRGGLQYEAEVYSRILKHIYEQGITMPQYYGSYLDQESSGVVLILGMIENGTRVHKANNWIERMELAMRWLGRFHNIKNTVVSEKEKQFLIHYDRDYYTSWVTRARLFTSRYHSSYPWLGIVCDNFELGIQTLTQAPQHIIHGKYTPKEIIISQGDVYPVDWESAALGVPEIDLAMFLYGWKDTHVAQWINAYKGARWPKGAPDNFEKLFYFSQLYVHMRWLGDQQDSTSQMIMDPVILKKLQTLSENISIIQDT